MVVNYAPLPALPQARGAVSPEALACRCMPAHVIPQGGETACEVASHGFLCATVEM